MNRMTIDEIKRYSQVYVRVLGNNNCANDLEINGGRYIMEEFKDKIYYANLVSMLIKNNADKSEEEINKITYDNLKSTQYKQDKLAFYNLMEDKFNCHFESQLDNMKFKKLCITISDRQKENELVK